MHSVVRPWARGFAPVLLLVILTSFSRASRAQNSFTVQVGPLKSPPTTLVSPTDLWRFHKGTNAPVVGWQTNSEASLDATWLSGPGGFGYADNAPEVARVQTTLLDMQNRYSTFYLRRTFEVTNALNPDYVLQLIMDWDDGFVAWLDGVELSPRMNAPGAAGSEPPNTATATMSHESSLGTGSPQPAQNFSLGPIGNGLAPGTHTLAIMGLNQATNSSDFVLVPQLLVQPPGDPGSVDGTLLSIVQTNRVTLSGSNNVSASTRVLVNGAEAAFDAAAKIWDYTIALQPGLNRVLIQVMDSGGVQLLVTNKNIISESASVSIGGVLSTDTTLTAEMGVLHVTNTLSVAPGGTLSVGPGCVLLFSSGANIAITNASLFVQGSDTAPVFMGPRDGSTAWGGLVTSGTAARVRATNLELASGHLELFDGGQVAIEDGYLHDYTISSPPIIHTLGQPNHCALTLRRVHVNRYYEILCQLSTNIFEDCLMEYQAQGGDGIDFDGGQPGSVLRRCTVRHGKFTNVDAIDMGEFSTGEPSRGVLIDSCLLYDFVDKGVSMGVQVDVTVTNCLLHHLDSGISVKDYSTAGIYACTIASNNFGFHCYNKSNPSSPTGGGFITNSWNNILWGNGQAVSLANGSTLTASYSDFQGITVPGAGNLSVDPSWLAPEVADFRLAQTSPVLQAGVDGAPLGATFPVGAIMAASHPSINSIETVETNAVVRFWADSERTYSLLVSETPGGPWTRAADVFTAPAPHRVSFTNALSSAPNRFYRLVTPRLP